MERLVTRNTEVKHMQYAFQFSSVATKQAKEK